MANVIDIKSRRDQQIHLRKDARADALRGDLRDARQDFQSEDKAKSQTKATKKLLSIFKSKHPPRS